MSTVNEPRGQQPAATTGHPEKPVSLSPSPPPPPDLLAGLVNGEIEETARKKKKKDKKKDKLGSARGVETLFRTSYRTHIDMSALADTKANIMITINGLMVSILLASISPKIDANPWLLLPTTALLLGCIISMVYAVLAARPRLNSRGVTLDEVRGNAANILFFGNFVSLPQDDYVQGMTELIKDGDRLYVNMLKDIYNLGVVLERKFRLLRISYTVFMFGLVIGAALFVAVFIGVVLFGTPPQPLGTQSF
jgi:hypothetical protein